MATESEDTAKLEAANADAELSVMLNNASNLIVELTEVHWSQNKFPYFLARITPDLKLFGIDFKPLIFPENTKSFVINNLSDKVKIVTHPTQRAKIGLIPIDADYNFDAADKRRGEPASAQIARRSAQTNKADAFLAFLAALDGLPEEEINKIVIPTSVIIELLKQ